jgi:hypothetical protein
VVQPASIAAQPAIASSRVAPVRFGIAAERSVELIENSPWRAINQE